MGQGRACPAVDSGMRNRRTMARAPVLGEDGKVTAYRARVSISFKYEG